MPISTMKLELIALPVSDVDRAKAFYVEQFGFVAEHDHDMGTSAWSLQELPLRGPSA